MTKINLSELEAKAKAATPKYGTVYNGFIGDEIYASLHVDEGIPATAEDLRYIAACSPDVVLALIEALREAKKALEIANDTIYEGQGESYCRDHQAYEAGHKKVQEALSRMRAILGDPDGNASESRKAKPAG